jgi:hypothetical protein
MTQTAIRQRRTALFLIGGIITAALIASFFQLVQPTKAEATQLSSATTISYSRIIPKPVPRPLLPVWEQQELIDMLEKREGASERAFNYNDYTYTAFWYRWTRVNGKLTTEPLERKGLSYANCVKSPYCNPDLEIGRTPKKSNR